MRATVFYCYILLAVGAQRAAPLLGDVGKTTVAGTVSTGVRTPFTLRPGENIYGPFEAGFSSRQDFILESLGCASGSLGHVAGGIDTETAERMVEVQCGVELPRYENGIRISLLDDCGGHTREYHFHERLRCLYEDVGAHSKQVGVGNDGKYIYGKWEDASSAELPLLDACGGHWGTTPDSPDVPIYHYHVQERAPFIIGCYGPNDDQSLVTVEQCRDLYPGCSGQATTLSTGEQYELWCPCYDADGSNHGTKPLPVFTSGQPTNPTPSAAPAPFPAPNLASVSPDPFPAPSPVQAEVVGEGYCSNGFAFGFVASISACEAACDRVDCSYFAFCPSGSVCTGPHANYCALYSGSSCPLISALGPGYTAYRPASEDTANGTPTSAPATDAGPVRRPQRPRGPRRPRFG